jgi:hypothetical protein
MTKDEIIEMAEQAGFVTNEIKSYVISPYTSEDQDLYEELEVFAKLIAEKAIKEALAQPEQEPVAWEQFYPDIGKPQIEQPKVRTGDCLLVGVCASEGQKIQKAQPEQEPVAWGDLQKEAQQIVESKFLWKKFIDGTPLANDIACWMADFARQYTTPPQRTWVGLTDEEAMQICIDCGCMSEDWLMLLDAIEAKIKDKNTRGQE